MKRTIRLTESELRGMINEVVKGALNEIGDTKRGFERQRDVMNGSYGAAPKMRFDYDVAEMEDMDALGRKFIDFIENYEDGMLMQEIVDYESGNQTGTPESGFPAVLGEFEDEVLGYDCSSKMKKALKQAYNHWWFYAENELMPEKIRLLVILL